MLICIAGKNSIAVDIAGYFLSHPELLIQNRLVVTCNRNEDGKDGWQPSLRAFAKKHHIEEVELESLYGEKDLLFLSLEYDRIVRSGKFQSDQLYNIHFSLLPQYKGMYTAIMPLLNHESCTGVTFHRINEGIDCGDIWRQTVIPIEPEDTSYSVYMKCLKEGTALVREALYSLLLDHVPMKFAKQPKEGSTYFSKESFDYRNRQIDFGTTAMAVIDQIRALHFRVYQMPEFGEKKIIDGKILDFQSHLKPGTCLFSNEHGAVVSTVDYAVAVYYDRMKELMQAIEQDDRLLVRDICSVKAHINEQDCGGMTPLMQAAKYARKEIVEYLILMGADPDKRDFCGRTVHFYYTEDE